MTTLVSAERGHGSATAVVRIALLGLGNVGGAIARLARDRTHPAYRFEVVSALVRDEHRVRGIDTTAMPLTTAPAQAFASRPDVIVETLGGLEPARTLVLAALAQGLPVVTANKSLLAAHGDEVFAAAAATGTPLLYEASVLAGVPFMGMFRRRPLAADVSAIMGILNGTSNYILTRIAADRLSFAAALAEARRSGCAEPDPTKDLTGADATEKLCVLLRHFGGWSIAPRDVETSGIEEIDLDDLSQAARFDGCIRPLVAADWTGGRLTAFVGPAFVPASNPLARVSGVQNAISLRTRWTGEVFFSGPGAGPVVTAATVLDDAIEAHALADVVPLETRRASIPGAPQTGWFIGCSWQTAENEQRAPEMLASLGIRSRRASSVMPRQGMWRQWLLTCPCERAHAHAALDVLASRTGASWRIIRAVD